MVKDNTYVHIEAFMVNDLHLSGNELITYAIIYGFSQDGESWFTGSRGYIAEWCQTSKNTVSNNLKKLVQKGLLDRRERTQNGVTLVDYRAKDFEGVAKKFGGGSQKICTPPSQKTCTHAIEVETIEDTIEKRGKRKRFTPPTRDEVAGYIREMGYGLDPDEFMDKNEMRGWRQNSGRQIVDWKACVRTFERNRKRWASESPSLRSRDASHGIDRSEPKLVRLPYGMMPESLVKTDEELGQMTQFQRDCYYHNARTYQRDWEAEHGNE